MIETKSELMLDFNPKDRDKLILPNSFTRYSSGDNYNWDNCVSNIEFRPNYNNFKASDFKRGIDKVRE